MKKPIRLAVLLSGSGRTLQNFLDRVRAGTLQAEVVHVVSSLRKAYGLQRARDNDIPATVVRKQDHDGVQAFSDAIWNQVKAAEPDLVALAGFMCQVRVPREMFGRVVNIHPALLPAFGGQGMYGHHVHEAVLEYGCKVSGCTVHFVNDEYDAGPIILQKTVPVLETDTADTLADRVFEEECKAYPEAINLFAQGRLSIAGRRVRIAP